MWEIPKITWGNPPMARENLRTMRGNPSITRENAGKSRENAKIPRKRGKNIEKYWKILEDIGKYWKILMNIAKYWIFPHFAGFSNNYSRCHYNFHDFWISIFS